MSSSLSGIGRSNCHAKIDVFCGKRVVVPKAGREEVLRELHDAHPGETRMKRIAPIKGHTRH